MGSEKSLWTIFRKHVTVLYEDKISLQRHEDTCSEGITDVSFSIRLGWADFRSGWIELKYRPEYPVRSNNPVRLEHFTDAQRVWLHERGSLGARCCVLWQIGKDYYVFNWQSVYDLGHMTKDELHSIAYWYSIGRPDWEQLMRVIAGK